MCTRSNNLPSILTPGIEFAVYAAVLLWRGKYNNYVPALAKPVTDFLDRVLR